MFDKKFWISTGISLGIVIAGVVIGQIYVVPYLQASKIATPATA
jgi:spore coat protein CotH